MKKFLLVLISGLLLVGCGKSKDNIVENMESTINNLDNYHLLGDLTIQNNEDKYNYSVDVTYKKGNYYKVSLVNKENSHEQIILKNDEGVYIVTPSLNKSFKFQSEWPTNSSQSYILETILKDIKDDEERTIVSKDNKYTITSKVNYPNNADLTNQVVTVGEDNLPKEVIVKNSKGTTAITMKIAKIDTKTKYDKNYFALSSNVKEQTDAIKPKTEMKDDKKETTETCDEKKENCKANNNETTENTNNNETTETTSASLEDIVYPMYLPSGTTYSKEEVVTTSGVERVILTYTGVKPFILIEEKAVPSSSHETTQVNGDFVLYNNVLGIITDTSLNWNENGKNYYLIGDNLTNAELLQIASSTATVAITK